jgi:hypothetical protein
MQPSNPLSRYAIMDDEYRLAWAEIEGWTSHAKSRLVGRRTLFFISASAG